MAVIECVIVSFRSVVSQVIATFFSPPEDSSNDS